jgi:hypothetical protein
MASATDKKVGGRPKAKIHELFKRVPGGVASNPQYTCVGCETVVKGNELYKLCEHAVSCTYLSEQQTELARESTTEITNKRLQK